MSRNDKPISKHFADLGAPLANIRQSWGAVRRDAPGVILRVWDDRKREVGGKWFRQVLRPDGKGFGYTERVRHVEMLTEGAVGFMVVCEVVDPEARPRTIKSYFDLVVPIGEVTVDPNGEVWAECLEPLLVSEFLGRAIK